MYDKPWTAPVENTRGGPTCEVSDATRDPYVSVGIGPNMRRAKSAKNSVESFLVRTPRSRKAAATVSFDSAFETLTIRRATLTCSGGVNRLHWPKSINPRRVLGLLSASVQN
jgi:hypothetical protein